MNKFPLYLALALTTGGAASWAQPQPAGNGASGTHMCGGIGQGDQQRMKDAARDHDLMLTFATANGSYLADVQVQIRDSHGSAVVDVRCDGPIMLVDLPAAGSYRVTARAGGIARDRTVTLVRGKRPASATFVWPDGTS
ncbi:MAG: hypothetical protein JWQ33_3058 [Ramlibacter sp.]|nr:hypothetical protein [Ramlibacter sp.]